jgi:hypothetical protein
LGLSIEKRLACKESPYIPIDKSRAFCFKTTYCTVKSSLSWCHNGYLYLRYIKPVHRRSRGSYETSKTVLSFRASETIRESHIASDFARQGEVGGCRSFWLVWLQLSDPPQKTPMVVMQETLASPIARSQLIPDSFEVEATPPSP